MRAPSISKEATSSTVTAPVVSSSPPTSGGLVSSPSASRRNSSQAISASPPNSDPIPGGKRRQLHANTLKPSSGSPNKPASPSSRSSSVRRSKTSTPVSASSKFPSGVSTDEVPGSPQGSNRIVKLEFSFSSEMMARTKRWRATLQREPSSEPNPDDLPLLFKVFSAASKLLSSIRADFRSGLTLYCRLVVPNRTWHGSSKLTHDPSAPHKALSELLGRVTTQDMDSFVPAIPDLMYDMMPLKYKRLVKRDVGFATAFRDQRTKFIEDVKQVHLSYTEQRIAAENIKSRMQEIEENSYEEGSAEDMDELCLQADRLALDFGVAVLQLHVVTINSLQVQSAIGSIVAPMLESYNSDLYQIAKDATAAELNRTRQLIAGLQSEISGLN